MEIFLTPKVKLYTIYLLVFSWGAAGVFAFFGQRLGEGVIGIGFPILYMFFPLFVSYILFRKESGVNFKEHIGLKFTWNRWFVLAWLSPLFLTIIIIGVNLLSPNVTFSWEMAGIFDMYKDKLSPKDFELMQQSVAQMPIHPFFLTMIQSLLAGITINAVAAFGEEAGWRGYLYRELEGVNFWRVSLFIGVIWGIWHAPLIVMGHNYPHYPYIGIIFMTIFTILMTPLLLLVREKSGSVLAPAVLHGSLNAIAGLSIMMTVGGDELSNGWTGISGFGVLILVNLAIYRYLKKDKIGREVT